MPDEDKPIANLGEQYELERLNTYIRSDLNRRLAHRSADRKGTKVEQVKRAVELYLKLYDGYGSLTPDEARVLKDRLIEQGYLAE